MITAAEIARAVYGAYRLARSDPSGMNYFDKTVDGFWRSFFAAALLAPFYALLIAIGFTELDASVDPWRYATAQTIGYAMAWVAFPLAMLILVRVIGREEKFLGYICAYNWSAIIQNVVILPVAFLQTGGFATPGIALPLGLGVLALVLAYVWFIARTALDVPPATAAGIVALDFVVTGLIDSVTESLSLYPAF